MVNENTEVLDEVNQSDIENLTPEYELEEGDLPEISVEEIENLQSKKKKSIIPYEN